MRVFGWILLLIGLVLIGTIAVCRFMRRSFMVLIHGDGLTFTTLYDE